MDLLTIVVSSAVSAAVVSAVVSGWFSLRTKQNEYANSYYKLVLERRLSAYEEVEKLIGFIKICVIDSDDRPYHLLFSKDDDEPYVYQMLGGTMSKALWLSDELFELTRQLNLLIYKKANKEHGMIEFGKQHYNTIAELRTKMEKVHLKDMLTLHDAPAFLKSKKPTDTYDKVPTRD